MGRRARRTSARRGWDGQAVIGEAQGVRQPGANRVVSDAAWRYRPIVFDTVRYSTVFRASIGERDGPGGFATSRCRNVNRRRRAATADGSA